jgi:hypothetical protein
LTCLEQPRTGRLRGRTVLRLVAGGSDGACEEVRWEDYAKAHRLCLFLRVAHATARGRCSFGARR